MLTERTKAMAPRAFLASLDASFPEATIISILVRVRVEAAQDLLLGPTLLTPLIHALHKVNRAADLELDVLLVSRVYIGRLTAR